MSLLPNKKKVDQRLLLGGISYWHHNLCGNPTFQKAYLDIHVHMVFMNNVTNPWFELWSSFCPTWWKFNSSEDILRISWAADSQQQQSLVSVLSLNFICWHKVVHRLYHELVSSIYSKYRGSWRTNIHSLLQFKLLSYF